MTIKFDISKLSILYIYQVHVRRLTLCHNLECKQFERNVLIITCEIGSRIFTRATWRSLASRFIKSLATFTSFRRWISNCRRKQTSVPFYLFRMYRTTKSIIHFKTVDLVHLSSPRSTIDLVSWSWLQRSVLIIETCRLIKVHLKIGSSVATCARSLVSWFVKSLKIVNRSIDVRSWSEAWIGRKRTRKETRADGV